MEEYNEREMARMKKLIILCVILMVASMVPMAAAITVDGIKDSGEWNSDWAYNQTQATSPVYDTHGPFGDLLVMMQGALDAPLVPAEWADEDPQDDGGPSFNDVIGSPNPSGFDIRSVSVHYDAVNDILYGLCEVYGIPGDLDGDGNVSTDINVGDANGDAGPSGTGIGPEESWEIQATQGTDNIRIIVTNNNWSVTGNTALSYDDVTAIFNPANDGVYEISIEQLSSFFNLSLGAPKIMIEVRAGGSQHTPGEDTATAFVYFPDPAIDIEKSTNGADADSPTGPILDLGDQVIWEYVITNTGVDPLSNIVVTDDMEGNVVLPQTDLEPQESMNVTVNGQVTSYGQYANMADVVGDFVGIPVADNDPSHYLAPEPNPGIDIEKHTNGVDADHPRGPYLNLGDQVTWEYIVTNTGDVPLSNIVVNDDKIGVITLPKTTLDPQESMIATAFGTATDYGQYENEADVTGEYNANHDTVDDKDPSHYYVDPPTEVPALTPVGLLGLIGVLGIIGIVGLKRRD